VACDVGAGTATITPTTSTISYSFLTGVSLAQSSVSLLQGQCAFVYSDNTNYYAIGLAINGGSITNAMLAGSIALSKLATQSANTVVANVTGSSAAPTAAAIPSGIQNYVAGTGYNQATTHQIETALVCADSSASSTAQVCNTSPTFTPAAGDAIIYTTTTANTGTGLTVNVNSLGAKSVSYAGSTTIAANYVKANQQVLMVYDGTNWELSKIDVAISGSGDTITTPNSTLSVGGTSSNTTLDVVGAAGKILAGSTPALTFTPTLGVDNTNAGTLTLANGSLNAHTTLGSAASTSNTMLFPATVPTNLHLFYCATASTTCTLTDTGYAYNAIPNADLVNSAITIAGTSVSLGGSTSSLPSPGAIGGTTPAAITGTTITANTSLTVNGGTAQVGTKGTDTNLMTTASGSTFTASTIAIGDANGGITNATAIPANVTYPSPGAIGGTTPAAGSFTTLTGTTINTTTKCAAAGTAANPSVASCSAAPTGFFSCATNASTGTCQVNTTAVTANSTIQIQPDSTLGTALSVTCNTTQDTGLTAPRISARSAGASFTIKLGTFSTNPLCFSYVVIN